MEARLSPRVGVLLLLGTASLLASNHLCARLAFNHGASVTTGVSVRAAFTALVLLALMRLQRVRIAIPRELRWPALVAGLLFAAQSYCLYSAVAVIPPALALLVFQTSPMVYVLLSWALGKEAPPWRALAAMPLALVGLAAALNLRPEHFAADWAAVRAGVGWAFASGLSMAIVYYLNANPLRPLDGRLRTFAMAAITAVLVIAGAGVAGAQALPSGAPGWTGLALLTLFYCVAIVSLFYLVPRVHTTTTVALNFEPIALLFLSWIFLGFTVTLSQIAGALLTVGAIVWLGLARR
jgi:drug/metabolite transporter (DMT)-like permease